MASVAETLNKAADVIEQRGWLNAWDVIKSGGEPNTVWGIGGSGPLCIEGGIAVAAGIQRTSHVPFCPATIAVAEYLGLERGERLYSWNDKTAYVTGEGIQALRTQAEVIEVLRAAALIEAAKKQPLVAAASREQVSA